jgi:hypothetical protein
MLKFPLASESARLLFVRMDTMATTPTLAHRMAFTVPTTSSVASLSAPARGTTATMAVADTATTDAGVAMTTAATTGTATVTPVAADSITAAVASMVVKASTAAEASMGAVDSMAVEASTAAVAVDPTAAGAADIGNSPRFIQQSIRTAASICCQPFSIVRQLPLQSETIQSRSPRLPAPNRGLQGPRKWQGPESATAPSFIACQFVIFLH